MSQADITSKIGLVSANITCIEQKFLLAVVFYAHFCSCVSPFARFWLSLLVVLVITQTSLYAQGFPVGGLGNPFGRPSNSINQDQDTAKKDSIPPRPKKPRYFPKTIAADWHWHQLDTLRFTDSQLLINHRYTPEQRSFQPILELGTPGGPQLLLTNGNLKTGFTLGLPLADAYLLQPRNFSFHEVGQPYTRFQYSQGAGGYTGLEALHTQNFSPTWNLTLNYRSVLNEDHYTGANQDNLMRNLALGSSFRSQDGRYENELIFSWNRNRRVENGGMSVDSLFYGNGQNQSNDPILRSFGIYVPRLNSTNSFYSQTQHRLKHRYYLNHNKKHYLLHQLFWQNERFVYTDESRDTSVYGNSYRINAKYIDDSTSLQSRLNTLGWGISDTIKNQAIRLEAAYNYQSAGYRYQSNDSVFHSSNFHSHGYTLLAQLKQSNRWIWMDWQQFLSGYLSGNYHLQLHLKQTWNDSSYLYINYLQEQASPNIYHSQFQNNQVDFRNLISVNHRIQHQRIETRYQYHSPNIDFFGSVIFGNINGEVRAVNSIQPEILANYQYVQTTLGMNAELGKHWFAFGSIHGQRNNAKERQQLGLPSLFSRLGLSYQNQAFSKALIYRLGFDIAYSSEYQAWQYRPDVRQFYFAQNTTLGNYPLLDVFLSGRIQTVDFFIKYEHLNNWWVLPFTNDRYESTLGYPIQPDRFRFGFVWHFWN